MSHENEQSSEVGEVGSDPELVELIKKAAGIGEPVINDLGRVIARLSLAGLAFPVDDPDAALVQLRALNKAIEEIKAVRNGAQMLRDMFSPPKGTISK